MTVLAMLVFSVSAQSETLGGEGDWCRFRGPNGSGVSLATTVPVRWTEQDYNWTVETPGVGHSSPVVWGDRIFLTSGDRETAGRMVLCFDTADGRTVWRRDFVSTAYRHHGANSYMSATPAVAGGVLCLRTHTHLISLGGKKVASIPAR